MYRSPLTDQARITSTFAQHRADSRRNFAGIDLVYASGESYQRPIVAVSDQRIIKVQNDFVDPNQPLRYGEKYIYAQDIANPRVTFLYLHNDVNLVSEGQTVKAGQEIAKMGYSGWTVPDNVPKGTHLHFEVRIDNDRVDPADHVDFNKFDQMPIITPSGQDIVTLTAQAGEGVSHLLKRAGRQDFADESAWLETSRLNGVTNGLMRVLLGQQYKVYTKPQKATTMYEVKPEQPKPVKESTPEQPKQVEEPVIMPEPVKETRVEPVKAVAVKPHSDGRILGVSKKLTSALAGGIEYLAILNSLPPEVLSQEVAGLPISLWVGGIIGVLHSVHIFVQGAIDYKSK